MLGPVKEEAPIMGGAVENSSPHKGPPEHVEETSEDAWETYWDFEGVLRRP